MALPLQEQKEALERELEKAHVRVVRDALTAQLAAVKKKLTASAGRTVTLGDGTVVTAGDTVYQPRTPSRYQKGNGDGPELRIRTVCKVAATGDELCLGGNYGCSGGKHDYEGGNRIFGKLDAAKDYLVKCAEADATESIGLLNKAKAALATDQHYLAKVQQLDITTLLPAGEVAV